MKILYKRYGLSQLLKRFEHEILFYHFYLSWTRFTPDEKEQVRRTCKKIIRQELLGHELLKAIALDLLPEGQIRVDSPVFRYLKLRVYDGDSRSLIGDLQRIKLKS